MIIWEDNMSKLTKIVICGSRYLEDYNFLKESVEDVFNKENIDYNNLQIVTGHANGADYLGERFAAEKGISFKIFPADWLKYGKAAGPIRNRRMVDYIKDSPCLVIAFESKNSKGTKNMITQSEKAGIKVYKFEID